MSRSDVYGYDLGRSPDPHNTPKRIWAWKRPDHHWEVRTERPNDQPLAVEYVLASAPTAGR
jgi:hypothetical protein